jgi:hypothetical protein
MRAATFQGDVSGNVSNWLHPCGPCDVGGPVRSWPEADSIRICREFG